MAAYVLIQGRLPNYANASSIESKYGTELEDLRAYARRFPQYRWSDNLQEAMKKQLGPFLSLPEVVEASMSRPEIGGGGRSNVELVDKRWRSLDKWVWGFSAWPDRPGRSMSILRRTAGRDYADYKACLLDESGQAVVLSLVLDIEHMRR